VLHRSLALAVRWRLIPRNPCEAVEAPRPTPPEMRTWTAAQAHAFQAGTADDELHALWRLALMTGMRRGELLALRWADIDLGRGALAVRRTLARGKDGLRVNEPKSASGRRAIALPASCVTALKRHQRRQTERMLKGAEAWRHDDLVFDRGDGSLLHPNVAYETFRRRAARLGLPVIRFHDLRHTAATLALARGIHPKVVAERLGHRDVGLTLNRYSHVSMDMQREAADRIDEALDPGAGEPEGEP
jgi:integrase